MEGGYDNKGAKPPGPDNLDVTALAAKLQDEYEESGLPVPSLADAIAIVEAKIRDGWHGD